MFDRWLKRKPTDSELLDLKSHKPSEFSGKTLSLEGREYRIGRCVRESNQGYSHRLTNLVSGLCQHVIQIRPEYLTAPEIALRASRHKAEATAALRAAMRASGNNVEIPPITVRQAHGGSFELHETSWGMMGHDADPPAVEAINKAVGLMRSGDYKKAISSLEWVLATRPTHTAALANIAGCYTALGDPVNALAMCDRAINIEPNLALYRGHQIINAVNCPRRYHASKLFDDFLLRYPLLREYDSPGIHAYLRTGQAPKASEILQRASALQPNEVCNIRPAVEIAMRAYEGFAELDRKVRQAGPEMLSNEEMLSVLNKLYDDCPVDPYIQANLGLALARAGEHRRAALLLFSAAGGMPDVLVHYCWASASYSDIASGEWKRTMLVLENIMATLKAGANGPVQPCHVPGVATWIHRTGALQPFEINCTHAPSAADIIGRAIQCPDASLVTPTIREMHSLLRHFQSQVSS